MTDRTEPAGLTGDRLGVEHPDRCRVCALPLPAGGSTDGICSRRCAGRRKESAAVMVKKDALTAQVLSELADLRPGTTICPGELSHRVLPGVDQPLTVLRPLLFELAAGRQLRLSQKGAVVGWWKIKGPFRVGR